MSVVLGGVCFLAGLFLIFVGRPNSAGQNPAFARGAWPETFYPVICLTLLVFGAAFVGKGFGLI